RSQAGAHQQDASGARGDQGPVKGRGHSASIRAVPGTGPMLVSPACGRQSRGTPLDAHCVELPSGEPSDPEGHAPAREAVMNARSCGRRGLGRGVLNALSIILLAAGCSRQASTDSDVARPVKTMVVVTGEEPHLRVFPGKVEASKRVELAFQVPGRIVKLPVKEGDKVKKGELIAQLRQADFEAVLKDRQGQLD